MKVISALLKEIKDSEINSSLDLAYYLGEVLFYNEIPFFDLSIIEQRLVDRVLISNEFDCSNRLKNKGFLFVVSQPYITGGHTRLMENLSLMLDDEERDLLITRGADEKTKQRLRGYFTNLIECYREETEIPVDFIKRLVCEIIEYEFVILNTHPEDIFTIVACGIAKKIKSNLKVYFVNHADHTFSYGATIADFWFEISLYGQQIDNLRGLIGKRSFLGIPIKKSDSDFFKNINYPALGSINQCVTAASWVKYKPYYGESMFSLIHNIIKYNKNIVFNVLGARLLRDYWWWIPKLRFFSQLNIKKSIPYEEYMEITSRSDLYIDSHPMPGGTAFVEQFIQGVPCVGLTSDYFGYTPLEKFKKESVSEVIEMLKSPPHQQEIKNMQDLVFQIHGFSQVKKRFISTIYNGTVFDNPMTFLIDSKEIRAFKKKGLLVSKEFFRYLFCFNKLLFLNIAFISKPISIFKGFLYLLSFPSKRFKKSK